MTGQKTTPALRIMVSERLFQERKLHLRGDAVNRRSACIGNSAPAVILNCVSRKRSLSDFRRLGISAQLPAQISYDIDQALAAPTVRARVKLGVETVVRANVGGSIGVMSNRIGLGVPETDRHCEGDNLGHGNQPPVRSAVSGYGKLRSSLPFIGLKPLMLFGRSSAWRSGVLGQIAGTAFSGQSVNVAGGMTVSPRPRQLSELT